jgi:predicted ATPase/DNA-binding SARP family transcriptional activator
MSGPRDSRRGALASAGEPTLPPLPVELTSFIGRGRELAELRALLARSRLLTLTGAGGSGKTRLALALARSSDGPVAWASLGALTEASLLPLVVAEAFGVPDEVSGADPAALIPLLEDRRAMLVLDNCEHLVESSAQLADLLVRGCPGLTILATSREALGVRGERAWFVPPLSLPGGGGAAADGTTSESVALFLERSREVLPSFSLTTENAAAVEEVCRRLDGIPLAIELAASRIRLLSPEQLRDRLDDAFRVLGEGGRTAPARHRTLRAAIDWSHELLWDSARVLFRRMSVFRNGFTLDALEAVAAGDGIEREDVLDLLGRLIDRSLVVVREHSSDTRYALLETVRQYAEQRLMEAGESGRVRLAHARWVLSRASESEPGLIGPERPRWLARLLPETDNGRAALEWSRAAAPEVHVELVGAIWWFLFSTQHWSEARRWIESALALPEAGVPGLPRAKLLFAGGALAALQGRPDARALLVEARELARRYGDERLHAYASNYLGMTYAGSGQPEAAPLCHEAAEWFRAHGDLYGLRLSLLLLGSAATYQGRLEEGRRLNEEGVEVARRFGLPRELAISLQNLAIVHLVARDFARAEAHVREALSESRRDPSYVFIANGLSYLGEILLGKGRAGEATRLFGAAEATRERVGARPFPRDGERIAAAVATCKEALDPVGFISLWAEGRALTPEAALAEALERRGAIAAEDSIAAAASRSGRRAAGTIPVSSTTREIDLAVSGLGRFGVAVSGEKVAEESWRYAKPKELLLWLLLRRTGGTRDEIGRELWPEATPAQIKNSFHVTLHHLRKGIGTPEWIALEGSRYRLDTDLEVLTDWERFEAAARPALKVDAEEDSIRAALELYSGDLFANEVAGPWLLEERDRLRALHVDLSMALGKRLEARGDHAGAADAYMAIAQREDLNEEAHRRLMASWARSGERTRALRWYERLTRTLEGALDAEPEPETVALYERIKGE